MLYIYHGTDHTKIREKVSALRTALHTKRPEAEFFKLDDPEMVTADALDELSGGQGLFDRKYIVQLDGVLGDQHARDAIVEKAEMIAVSENVFLLIDSTIDKKTLKTLEKHAFKTDESLASQTTNAKGMNTFALADAFGKRDRKQLWVLFHQARRELKEPEEIHGILFWQAKAMILAGSASSASAAGLKQFPYNKAKKFRENYSDKELLSIAFTLVDIYHQARRGRGDMGSLLERFILTV